MSRRKTNRGIDLVFVFLIAVGIGMVVTSHIGPFGTPWWRQKEAVVLQVPWVGATKGAADDLMYEMYQAAGSGIDKLEGKKVNSSDWIFYTSPDYDAQKPFAYQVDPFLWYSGIYADHGPSKMEAEAQQAIAHKVALEKQALKENVIPGMTEREKIKAVHDLIVRDTAYDMKSGGNDRVSLLSHTAFGVVENHLALCSGYSLAFADYMSLLDIPCVTIYGKAGVNSQDQGYHAWNAVYLEGSWSYVDTTWDDPVPDKPGRVFEAFLLVPETTLRKTHSWDKKEEQQEEQEELKRFAGR